MRVLIKAFVILIFFVLTVFLYNIDMQAGFLSTSVYAEDAGLSLQERTSIQAFTERVNKSIKKADLFIRAKELNKAKKELTNTLISVKEEISTYEEKARALVSKNKQNSAKSYYKEASSLGKLTLKISKSLTEITSLEIDNNIKLSKACLTKNNFTKAQTLLEEALKLAGEQKPSRKQEEIKSLLSSIPNLKEKFEIKKTKEKSTYYATQGFGYLKSGNMNKAEDSFNKALDLVPDNRKAKDGLERIARMRNRMKNERISKLLKEAHSDIRMEAFTKAEEILQEVLKLDPTNNKAQDYLEDIAKLKRAEEHKSLLANIDDKIEEGENNLKMGRFTEAENNLNEALKILPRGEEKRKKKIESLFASIPELKQKYKAELNLRKIENIVTEARQEIEENNLAELIKQGKSSLIANNFEEAERKFSEALKIRPKNELVLRYLAETKQAKKDYENKKLTEELIVEGKKYLEAESLDKAEAVFKRALKVSQSQEKKLQLQTLLADVDKMRQTIYNRKLQQQADRYIADGIDNLNRNQYPKARADFEKALSIKPDCSEAEEWLRKLEEIQVKAYQDKLQTMVMEGREYLKNKKFDSAGAKFEEILKIDPAHSEALYYFNSVEKFKKEYENEQQIKKITLMVDNGIKYLEEGQFNKAESVFKQALESAPAGMKGQTVKIIDEGVYSFIHKAEIQEKADRYISDGIKYLNNNEFEKAEKSFTTALNIIPGYKKGEDYLQRLEMAKLKYQNRRSLERINNMMVWESEKLDEDELEQNIVQLIEQIKDKMEESDKILGREN